MTKDSKRKLTSITLLLILLLIASAYISLLPTVNAAEPNLQEKALSVLSDVVDLNTEEYATSQSTQRDNQFLSHPQTETSTYLASAESSLRVTCSYVKDTLKLVYLSDLEGELSLRQAVNNTVDMAKGLLERYKTYSGASVYGKFASMLNDIELNVDKTKYAENVKLDVSGSEPNRVSYMWTYVDSNGVPAEKKNVILIYEKGAFKGFFNNWPLYTIAETESKFSAEQATELAIEASRNFSYPVKFDNGTEIMVSGFSIDPESLGEAKLIYVNSVQQEFARDGDPDRLYLAWYVPLGFDRFYPGDVNGMTVILWADTGEVCGMDRVIVDSDFVASLHKQAIEDEEAVVQSSQPQPTDSSTQAVGVLAVAGLVFVSLGASQKIMATGHRKRGRILLGTLLCASISFSVIFMFLSSVSAVSVTGRSRIYSSWHTPDGYKNTWADKSEDAATADLCNYVGNASLDAGYITTNSYSNTINTVVVNDAGNDEQNYLNTMLFHAGHFAENPNWAYQDNSGAPIRAIDIIDETGLGRHFFVFLWVCVQAETYTSGTPVAWTHRDGSPGHPYMSSEGFQYPDYQKQCYISFYGFSPMLSNYVPQSCGYYYTFADVGTPGPCSWFAMKFYYYALCEGYSVHDSLDIASGEFFGCDYLNTVLYTGYDSWWPGGNWDPVWCPEHQEYHDHPLAHSGYYPRDFNDEFMACPWHFPYRYPNRMRVFGDSTIKLYQPQITLSGRDNNNNPVYPQFTIGGDILYSGNHRLVSKTYSVNVNDPPGYAFSHFSYKGASYYSRPASITLDSDGELRAHYLTPQPLTISSSGSGYTNPTGTQWYDAFTYAQVQAFPNSGYEHYWLLNNYFAGNTQTINVYMNGPKTLQAVFYPEQQHYFAAGIYDYGQEWLVEDPENLAGWQNDEQFAGLEGFGPYEEYGWISAGMNKQAAGHIYVYGSAVYSEGCVYVYVYSNGYSWDFVSSPYVSSGSPYWIDCGVCISSFNYIMVTAEDPNAIYSVALDSVRVEPLVYYNLTVSSGAGGYTVPATGVHEYPETSQVPVTAYANGGYDFDYWLLDGNSYAQNPITVTMNSNHTLQAFFCEETPPVYHWLTVEAYDEYEYELNPGVWVDSGWAGYAPVTVQVLEGWHTVEVEETWLYWRLVEFSDGYGNGDSRPVYSDKTITAYYEFDY